MNRITQNPTEGGCYGTPVEPSAVHDACSTRLVFLGLGRAVAYDGWEPPLGAALLGDSNGCGLRGRPRFLVTSLCGVF